MARLGRHAMASQNGGWSGSGPDGEPGVVAFALRVAGLALWEWDATSDEVRWQGASFAAPVSDVANPRTLAASLLSIHPEDRERLHSALLFCAAGDGPVHEEVRIVDGDHPGDEPRWLMVEGDLYRAH